LQAAHNDGKGVSRSTAVFGTILLAFATQVFGAGGMIDFETVPGSASADQLAIFSQYQGLFGVTFSLSTGGTPFLEAVGSADVGNGFVNDNLGGLPDVAASGYTNQLKNFFLRLGTTTLESLPVPRLVITYSAPVTAASAEIWDIDAQGPGTEQWLVEAYNGANAVVDSSASPLGTNNGSGSLDGKPWAWSFNHGMTADIHRIELSFTGSKTNGIGLAFDNFSPSSPVEAVPEPSALLMLLSGLGAIGARLRFKRRRGAALVQPVRPRSSARRFNTAGT
jgi:hypothetical protein